MAWLTGGEIEETMGIQLPPGTPFTDPASRQGSTGLGVIGASAALLPPPHARRAPVDSYTPIPLQHHTLNLETARRAERSTSNAARWRWAAQLTQCGQCGCCADCLAGLHVVAVPDQVPIGLNLQVRAASLSPHPQGCQHAHTRAVSMALVLHDPSRGV